MSILKVLVLISILAKCFAHISIIHVITLTTPDEKFELLSSSLWRFIPFHIFIHDVGASVFHRDRRYFKLIGVRIVIKHGFILKYLHFKNSHYWSTDRISSFKKQRVNSIIEILIHLLETSHRAIKRFKPHNCNIFEFDC